MDTERYCGNQGYSPSLIPQMYFSGDGARALVDIFPREDANRMRQYFEGNNKKTRFQHRFEGIGLDPRLVFSWYGKEGGR